MDDCHLALVLIINIHFLCFLIALDFLSHVCCASISVDYYCFVILQHCVATLGENSILLWKGLYHSCFVTNSLQCDSLLYLKT